MHERFSLNSREEVIRFEQLLDDYSSNHAQLSLRHVSLIEAYDRLINRKDGARLFYALLDIQINIVLLFFGHPCSRRHLERLFFQGKA